MVLKGVRVGEVDRMLLMRIFGNIGKVQAESFAQTTELDFTLVLEAKFECLLGYLLK